MTEGSQGILQDENSKDLHNKVCNGCLVNAGSTNSRIWFFCRIRLKVRKYNRASSLLAGLFIKATCAAWNNEHTPI